MQKTVSRKNRRIGKKYRNVQKIRRLKRMRRRIYKNRIRKR